MVCMRFCTMLYLLQLNCQISWNHFIIPPAPVHKLQQQMILFFFFLLILLRYYLCEGVLLCATCALWQQHIERYVRRGSKTQGRSDEAEKGCGGGTWFYVLQSVLVCQCVPQPAAVNICICASLCGSQCLFKSIALPHRVRQVEMSWPHSGWWKGRTCKGFTFTYLQNNNIYILSHRF